MAKVTSISALAVLAVLVSASSATAGAAPKGDFETCGERAVADVPGPGSYKLILKVKRASCDAGQKVAHKYFKKAGSIVPELGNVEFVQHYRCVQKNYYSPLEPSFECRNRARDRVVKGLFPPENVRANAKRSKSCGSFRMEGLLTSIKVKITRGDFPCKVARRVMEDLFHGRDTGNWSCIGPQTGYAKCTKSNRGAIVARF